MAHTLLVNSFSINYTHFFQTPTAQILHQSEVLAQLTAKMQAMQAYILLIAPHTQQQVAHCQTAPVVQRLSAKSRRASWANNAQRNSWVNSEHRISEILREYPSQLQENIQAGVRKCSTCSQRSSQRRFVFLQPCGVSRRCFQPISFYWI